MLGGVSNESKSPIFLRSGKKCNFERRYPPRKMRRTTHVPVILKQHILSFEDVWNSSASTVRGEPLLPVLVSDCLWTEYFFTDNPPQAHVSRPAELQSLLNLYVGI